MRTSHPSPGLPTKIADQPQRVGLRSSAVPYPRVLRQLFGVFALILVVLAGVVRAAEETETLEERRARVAAMDPLARERLWDRYDRFRRMAPPLQDRLRRLHQELEQDPNGPELRQVMQRYADWFKTLPPHEQADLRHLAPEQRVIRIKRLLAEQAQKAKPGDTDATRTDRPGRPGRRGGVPLNLANVEAVLQWMDSYLQKKGAPWHDASQRREFQERLTREKDPVRRYELIAQTWHHWQAHSEKESLPFSDQDLAEVRSRLTPETIRKLQNRTPAEQWTLLLRMISLNAVQQLVAWRTDPIAVDVSDDELARFFEYELSGEERDRLVNLPSDEMSQELRRRYLQWQRKYSDWKRRGGATSPGGVKEKGEKPSESMPSDNPPPRPKGKQKPNKQKPQPKPSSDDRKPGTDSAVAPRARREPR